MSHQKILRLHSQSKKEISKKWFLFLLLWGGTCLSYQFVYAEKIVSIGGAVTETLFALGVEDQIVGRDTSSYYPARALDIPAVGYRRQLNAEGILSLRPDVMIAPEDLQPASIVSQLGQAGVKLILLKEATSCQDAQQNILQIGKRLQKAEQAKQLVQRMDAELKQLALILEKKSSQHTKTKALMLYVRGNRSQFILGQGSAPARMLEISGANNVGNAIQGVKPITAEAMVALAPEVLVLFQKGVQSIGGKEKVLQLPGVAYTPAGQNQRLVIMDDLYLAGYGPRCAKAALDLYQGMYAKSGIYTAGN